MKKGKLIYSILFFAVCLCPSGGHAVTKPETSFRKPPAFRNFLLSKRRKANGM